MDGAHPHDNSVAAYDWIKKGCIKEVKSSCGRQRLNINGALGLLRKIRKSGQIYIIGDNAGYYKSANTQSAAKELKGSEYSYRLIYLI